MIRIHELLVDHQPYHSNFQMDYLITRRHGGTLFACYKQSLRELERRFRALQQVCRERRDATTRDRAVEWEHHRTTEHATTSVFDDSATLVVIDTAREFLRFYALAAALKQRLGELTPERRAQLDEEMWEHRLKCLAAVDFISQGRLSAGTVEFLQACPLAMRRRVAELVLDPRRHAELIEWYLSYEPDLPPPIEVDRADLPRLLAGTPLAELWDQQFDGRNLETAVPATD